MRKRERGERGGGGEQRGKKEREKGRDKGEKGEWGGERQDVGHAEKEKTKKGSFQDETETNDVGYCTIQLPHFLGAAPHALQDLSSPTRDQTWAQW